MSDKNVGTIPPGILNIFIQGKGGVGKSVCASFLAQYEISQGRKPVCFDTDPVQPTFSAYKAFDTRRVNILEKNDINKRLFDPFIEALVDEQKNNPGQMFIADIGSSNFLAFCDYMLTCDGVDELARGNINTRLHVPTVGGEALLDTFNCFALLCDQFPTIPVVRWENEFFGPVILNGKKFGDVAIGKKYLPRIHAEIIVPEVEQNTFGIDIANLLTRHETFAEADLNPGLRLMERQRLRQFWRKLSAQIERARL